MFCLMPERVLDWKIKIFYSILFYSIKKERKCVEIWSQVQASAATFIVALSKLNYFFSTLLSSGGNGQKLTDSVNSKTRVD